jgi:hypothetical protein
MKHCVFGLAVWNPGDPACCLTLPWQLVMEKIDSFHPRVTLGYRRGCAGTYPELSGIPATKSLAQATEA